MKKAADMKNSEAMFQLGMMSCRGHGVEKDTKQGEKWFDLANSRRLKFTERIAKLFHVSEDMQNFTLAHKWYKRLETLNDINSYEVAQLGFGLLYEYGDGVEQDYQKALEYYTYYTTLSNNLRAVGTLRLGLMYYYGIGVAVDYPKSFELFKRAGKEVDTSFYHPLPYVYNINNVNGNDFQGDLVYCLVDKYEVLGEAEYYLGLHYKYGQGVSEDQDKAQDHFREAFSRGCKRAECELVDQHFKKKVTRTIRHF
jgi:TPR repeat protein